MDIFGKSEQKKKKKELKNELKQWRKQILSGGGDKTEVSQLFKDFESALELGESQYLEYEEARRHLLQAREAIGRLLEYIAESPAREVKDSLGEIIGDLEQIYHDCSIRQDDLDFASTISCLKNLAAEYQGHGMKDIMMRSELENIKAVLDDASGWSAPDFFALAYYNLKEDKSTLAEMENEQRNLKVISYLSEYFLEPFAKNAGEQYQNVRAAYCMSEKACQNEEETKSVSRIKKTVQQYIYGQNTLGE